MTYLLRDIDDTLWGRVKQRARSDGLSLRMAIILLLRSYAEGKIVIQALPRR